MFDFLKKVFGTKSEKDVKGLESRVEEINDLCVRNKKQLVVYVSMAFGNPYGDEWSSDVAITWTKKLAQMGIKIIALSDTIGVSNPDNIKALFSKLIRSV